jgi:Tfp pilus assembly protein PilF
MDEQNIAQQQATILIERAYREQMRGHWGEAIQLYRRSIAMFPTAEAHTFLGWVYSMMERYDEAIAECEQAIALDPGFGNPYNDIGAYLIELGQYEEAIPWLERALAAERYDSPQYPYVNMGRIYEQWGDTYAALDAYERALDVAPLYLPAEWARTLLLGRLN